MSKKKGASRSAMTLKDFHGGSIPSDLLLPSAPGMTVDRSVYERQGSGTWMSPTLGRGYGNDRTGYHRHGSSNGVRTFEDKASYFPNPANIGRNYDEDERKPVDGRPRSSHSADRFDDHPYEERRGGYSADRYTLEDQGSFVSASSFSEPRSSGASDRFPRSQVTGSGVESDIYVHDEFGLIPVGPPPSRVLSLESQQRQLPLHHRELADTRAEQPLQAQFQPVPLVPSYLPQQQIATSPPRSWRNPLHQVQSSTSVPPVLHESATNVWSARRDGDFNRTPVSDPPSENLGSSPWRPHGTAGRPLDARAVDKVSSGRWQSDPSRAAKVVERRSQFAGPVSEQVRESIHHKTYGADPLPDTGRSAYAPDVDPSRPEASRGLSKLDSGRVVLSAEAVQSASDETSRIGAFSAKKALNSRSGVGSDPHLGDSSGSAGMTEEQGGGYDGYGVDAADLQSHGGEELWNSSSSFSQIDGSNASADPEGSGHPRNAAGFIDSSRAVSELLRSSYVESRRSLNADDGRAEPIDQNRAAYRVGYGSSGAGLVSGNGRFSQIDSTRGVYGEDGLASLATDGRVMFPENGKTTATETGRDSFGSTASHPVSLERSGPDPSDKFRLSASEGWRGGLSAAPVDYWPAAPVEHPEILERPKLRLLPRSKPLEKIEISNVESEDLGEHEEVSNKVHSQSDDKRLPEILSVEATAPTPKRPVVKELGSAVDENEEDGIHKVARPKLNLKPRSQPAEAESEEGSQKVRQLVFGGARPRELVLKERGVDDLLGGALDALQTPVTASVPSSGSGGGGVKWEQADVVRAERPDSWADEKQDGRRYERQERPFERQGSNRTDRQESNRGDKGPDNKWDLEKDAQWDRERVDGRRKREVDRQDSRRDADNRRDIDKQESWRRPAESTVPVTGPWSSSSSVLSLVDPLPRTLGRYGYSPTASAVDLAQAFSRSSSIGSNMAGASRGTSSLRSPLSPIPKSSVQGFGPGYGNSTSSPQVSRDAPFSRLAEASTPSFIAGGVEIHPQGHGFSLESQTNYYGSGKLGVFASGDLKRGLSGRSDLGTVRGLTEENDDFPGKRGLPVRQKEGYFD